MFGLRMRQEDDADEVEKASYESHCVYAIAIAIVVWRCWYRPTAVLPLVTLASKLCGALPPCRWDFLVK